jgi:hypothetical protein
VTRVFVVGAPVAGIGGVMVTMVSGSVSWTLGADRRASHFGSLGLRTVIVVVMT